MKTTAQNDLAVADRDYAPFIPSNNLLADPPALRQRLADDGYLFFKGVAPREKLLRARRDVLTLCAQAGWVDAQRDLMEGCWSGVGPYTEGDIEYMNVYKNIIKLPAFLAVPEDHAYLDVLGKVLATTPLLHRLRIGRVTFPNNTQQSTASHQDWMYIRGTPQTYTVWTPLGDCPRELGGVAVLAGSHKAGFIEHRPHPQKKYAGMGLDEDQLPATGTRWVAGDFELGDFILFHSYTIHKALPNLTSDRLRLSTDNRYQCPAEEISEVSTRTHYGL